MTEVAEAIVVLDSIRGNNNDKMRQQGVNSQPHGDSWRMGWRREDKERATGRNSRIKLHIYFQVT
jgi:hypothetical protein